jgi:hypothetical protein
MLIKDASMKWHIISFTSPLNFGFNFFFPYETLEKINELKLWFQLFSLRDIGKNQ